MTYHIQGYKDKNTIQETMEKHKLDGQVLNQAEQPEKVKARTMPALLLLQKSLLPLLQWH
jgi:hypothetical protein